MRARWIHLSNGAGIDFPRWTVRQIWDDLEVPSGGTVIQPIPWSLGTPTGPHVTTVLEAHHNEAKEGQRLEFQLIDNHDQVIDSKVGVLPAWYELGPGYPLFVPAGTPIHGWPLPTPGRYRIRMVLDGEPVEGGEVEFFGRGEGEAWGAPSPTVDLPSSGFTLQYAHIADRAGPDGTMVSIYGISDFKRAWAGSQVFIEGIFVAVIVGGTGVGPRHRFQLEIRDGDHNLVKRSVESLMNFTRRGPGHLWKGLMAMPLGKIQVPDVGDYEIVSLVNGKAVGRIDYRIFPK